jgi:hypothetical protein
MLAIFQHQEQRARAQVQKLKPPHGKYNAWYKQAYTQRARAQKQERKTAIKLASVQITGIDPDVLSRSKKTCKCKTCSQYTVFNNKSKGPWKNDNCADAIKQTSRASERQPDASLVSGWSG